MNLLKKLKILFPNNCGMPGSKKGTSLFLLLIRLCHIFWQREIPFLLLLLLFFQPFRRRCETRGRRTDFFTNCCVPTVLACSCGSIDNWMTQESLPSEKRENAHKNNGKNKTIFSLWLR
jgi:hypothetical protein